MVWVREFRRAKSAIFLLQSASFGGVFGVFLPENGGLCLPTGKQAVFVTH
jgi:hypothetical protein